MYIHFDQLFAASASKYLADYRTIFFGYLLDFCVISVYCIVVLPFGPCL